MEKFALGMLLGGVGGALLVANNYKMRALVRKTQREVQAKFDELLDEKIRAVEVMTEDMKKDEKDAPNDKKAKKNKA